MKTRPIPEDTAKAAEAHISDEEWANAASAPERFRALLEPSRRRRLATTLYLLRSETARPRCGDCVKRGR